MNQISDHAKKAVGRFVASCGRDYEFPSGGIHSILLPEEGRLFSAIRSDTLSDADRILAMSEGLDWSDCYSIVIFGVRLAILAIRTSDPAVFRLGILALVAGGPKVDWRDLLGALAIFEDCGNRLHIQFRHELEAAVKLADDTRLRSTMDAYFSRPDAMRSVGVMGFVESGTGGELTFVPKGML